MKERLNAWIKENGARLLVFVGILLVGTLSFEAGLLQGKMVQVAPLVLSIPPIPTAPVGDTIVEKKLPRTQSEEVSQVASGVSGVPGAASVVSGDSEKTKCAFVGSKNSNKYHLPTCAVVKRIKPENRVCFASKEEAERRGYLPSCLK